MTRRPVLLLLFVGSGFSALIYEVVWFQLLQFVIGSTAVSLAVLLATFMGGMCVGSLGFAAAVPVRFHPLRVFAAVELGIGLCGIAVLFAAGSLGVMTTLCLVPPTLFMGASLPAVSRWAANTREGVSWLGLFYGGNIAGAVMGCLFAGFYLLRVHDMAVATYAAAAVNGAVAVVAFLIAGRSPSEAARPWQGRARAGAAYLAIALSGLCALGSEVIWTRVLSLMLGATVYTFSLILAAFLIGLGAGSGAGSWLSRTRDPRAGLGWCQLMGSAAIAWAAYALAELLPGWQTDTAGAWMRFAGDFGRTLLAVAPAACFWGASFPLALAAAAVGAGDNARAVGRVYAANTAGAIAGSILFSIGLIPWLGTQNCQRVLIAVSSASAALMLRGRAQRAGVLTGALLLAGVPALPWGVVAYGRHFARDGSKGSRLVYLGEGMNASVAVTELDRTRYFHVSGKVEASSGSQDMRLQRMLGHLPALINADPKSILVVGCGAGVTAGAFVPYPEVRGIAICEIEPLIARTAARYFARENHGVLSDRRTRVVYDDARRFVLATDEKFDVITSDPIHPWVKGAAALYTKEYFELCKRHLNPGGVVTQWVPLYESTLETVKSEIATFLEVFPNGTVWGNDTITYEGYDVVLLGVNGAAGIDVDAMEERLQRPEYARVRESLREVGFGSAVGLLSTYAGRGPDLSGWTAGAVINRDRNLRLQYLAGLGLNIQNAGRIYEDLMRYRRFPDGVMVAGEARARELRRALRRP